MYAARSASKAFTPTRCFFRPLNVKERLPLKINDGNGDESLKGDTTLMSVTARCWSPRTPLPGACESAHLCRITLAETVPGHLAVDHLRNIASLRRHHAIGTLRRHGTMARGHHSTQNGRHHATKGGLHPGAVSERVRGPTPRPRTTNAVMSHHSLVAIHEGKTEAGPGRERHTRTLNVVNICPANTTTRGATQVRAPQLNEGRRSPARK